MLHASGLPIPRFVSLKFNAVNLRVGPGNDYPIAWVYKRKGLPVEVVQEFGHWRKLRDMDGVEGWVHSNLTSGERSVIIRRSEGGSARVPIYATANSASRLSMEAEAGAIMPLGACEREWCEVKSDADSGQSGWTEKRFLWGVYADETIED